MKAIFLDKDGTLVEDLPYNVEQRRITLCAGVGAGLRLLARLDYRFFVVSNQDGIAHGLFGEQDVKGVAHRLTDLLFREHVELEGFYYCPHHPNGVITRYAHDCNCRKPKPGMLLQAAHDHGIDLRSSWMVGDILHDVEAGNRAGCRTLLIDNGNETEWRLGARRVPTRMAHDLYAAAMLITEEDRVPR